MKFKKATFLDQHIEKIVMAVAVLFALIVVVAFVLVPYRAEVPGVGDVRPGQVGSKVAERVHQLRQPRERIPETSEQRHLDRLSTVLGQDLRIPQRLVGTVLGRPMIEPLDPMPLEPQRYRLATPVAPRVLHGRPAYHYMSSLDEDQADLEQRLVSHIGGRGDFRAVHLVGAWDAARWVEALEERDVPDGYAPVPERLRSRVLLTDPRTEREQPIVVDVAVERERFDPDSDRWVDRQVIDRVPVNPEADFRDRPRQEETLSDLREALARAQAMIRIAPFIPVAYQWPGGMMDMTPQQAIELRQIDNRIEEIRAEARRLAQRGRNQGEIQRLQDQLDEQVERYNAIIEDFRSVPAPSERAMRAMDQEFPRPQRMRERRHVPRERQRWDGPGHWDEGDEPRPELEGWEGARNPRMPQPQREATRGGAQMQPVAAAAPGAHSALASPLERVQWAQRGEFDRRRFEEEEGWWDEADDWRPEQEPRRQPQQPQQRVEELRPGVPMRQLIAEPILAPIEEEQIDPQEGMIELWAHDATARPGQRYRYRLVVHVLNPFFDQAEALHEEQKDLAGQLTIASEPSAWAEVELEPAHYYFLAGASGRQATFEIWHLMQRRWHSHEFRSAAGDPVGGQAEVAEGRLELRMPVLLVDVLTASEAQAILVDTRDQQVMVRDASRDREDARRIRLKKLSRAWEAMEPERQDADRR